MFNIKRILAVISCAAICSSAMVSCSGDKDKEQSNDAFSISEVSGVQNNPSESINSDPNVSNREYIETPGEIGVESDYYGLKLTVEKVSEMTFDQIPGGKVLIVDISLTNDSEYDYEVSALANFDIKVDGQGSTPDYITAQVMTLTARYFGESDPDKVIFGTSSTPAIKPGETFKGYLPIALTSDVADFDTISFRFVPDANSGVYSCITFEIHSDDIK